MNSSFSRTSHGYAPLLRLPAACPTELSSPCEYERPTLASIIDVDGTTEPDDHGRRRAISIA